MARPRKPTAQKKATGTDYKCRKNLLEPSFDSLSTILPPPIGLQKDGKEFWKDNYKVLISGKILTQADLSLLEQASFTYEIMVSSRRSIFWDFEYKKKRTLKEYMNEREYKRTKMSELMTYEKTQLQMLTYYRELGLTPASRSRVEVNKDAAELSDMEKLLNGNH